MNTFSIMDKEKKFSLSPTFRYSFALGLLALLSLASYFILKENIGAQASSAAIVNVSGRQRMLSQRIGLYSLRLINAAEGSLRQQLRQELKKIIELMESSHAGLLSGSVAMNLPGEPSPEVQAMYFSLPLALDKQIRQYIGEARSLLSASDNELTLENTHLEYILQAASLKLIQSLDAVVRQYQKESERKIANLEALQFFVLFAALFVLFLTGVFLFRPMIKRIEEKTRELLREDVALLRSNEQLQNEIKERKELERQLRIVNEFDETLLKTIPFGIDIVDGEGNLLYLNEKMERVFGKRAIGKKCYLLYKDDKEQCLNCPLKNGVGAGEARQLEVTGAMQGRTFLITHTATVYQGKKAILEIFEDITEYKKAQSSLALSERLAVIGRMAGVIAHEFRNQLGVMRNAAYFLKMRIVTKDEKVIRHLEILDEQITETERIIENILAFSRTSQPQLQRVDCPELLKAALDKVRIPEGIKVEMRIESLPPLEIDPLQFGIVFFNIILNSLQAMGASGALHIGGTKADNYVILIFKDTGEGIREEDKKRIFEPFFSTKSRGTGLGLATAKIIIEKHKGSINLESEYGKGTAVIVKLPAGGAVPALSTDG